MKEIADDKENVARNLEASYTDALQEYLMTAGERALRRAYDVGREALAQGMGVLEFAALHHSSLANVLPPADKGADVERTLRCAAQFFAEALSPYEMAHRGYRDAVTSLRHLNETLEEEIRRIARTVHDEAGQLLVAVRLTLADVARDLHPPLQARLEESTGLLDQIEEQLRRLSHELRPTILDDLGLVPALEFLAEGISKRAKIVIRIESSLENRLSPTLETPLYRIVQEALTNITKHAKAKKVRIQLKEDAGKVCCSIHDDGVGFDVSAVLSRDKKGLGLVGIQERLNAIGGMLRIHSTPGQGTQLMITIAMEE